MEPFMCIRLFPGWLVPALVSLGIWARPQETMDLLNSWPKILSCIKEIEGESAPSPFDCLSATLKVIAVNVACQGAAFGAGVGTVIFSSIPICFLPIANRFGHIPDGILSQFEWQLTFFPLEYLIHVPHMLCATVSGGILMILVGVLKIYTNKLR